MSAKIKTKGAEQCFRACRRYFQRQSRRRTRQNALAERGRKKGVLGAALVAERFGPPPALAAEVKLPEITAIPERLKGSGVVRVCSYGGAFQDAQRKAYFEPFERLSGIKVIEAQGPDPAKIKAMVDTRNIE